MTGNLKKRAEISGDKLKVYKANLLLLLIGLDQKVIPKTITLKT